MYSLKPIFNETLVNIRKHFTVLAIISLLVSTFSLALEHYLKDKPFLLLISSLFSVLVYIWSSIAVFQIISNKPFSFSNQVMVLRLNFSRSILGIIASGIATARAYFPFIFPMFFRAIQLMFVSLILLLENNKHENALKKSKNLVGGKEWPLLGILILTTIPSLIFKSTENYLVPDAKLVLQIIASTLIYILFSVFIITFYKIRSQMVLIEIEEQPVSYGKIIKQTLLGGIGGIFWFVFVMMITGIVVGLVLKKIIKPADTAFISQPAAEQATTANASPTEWIHPINKKILVLPTGFTVSDFEDDLAYATFTTGNYHSEMLIVYQFDDKPDLSSIVDKTYDILKINFKDEEPNLKLSKPKMRKVKGQQVIEFVGVSPTNNMFFRFWAPDNTHYWQVISTALTGDEIKIQNSERMLEYLIENSLK